MIFGLGDAEKYINFNFLDVFAALSNEWKSHDREVWCFVYLCIDLAIEKYTVDPCLIFKYFFSIYKKYRFVG